MNPGTVRPAGELFTYISSGGSPATVYPNSLGAESRHADSVGENFYGISGVWPRMSRMWTIMTRIILIRLRSLPTRVAARNINDRIVNQSFTFGRNQPLSTNSSRLIRLTTIMPQIQHAFCFRRRKWTVHSQRLCAGNCPTMASASALIGRQVQASARRLTTAAANRTSPRPAGGDEFFHAAGCRRGGGFDAGGIARRRRQRHQFRRRHAHGESVVAEWRGQARRLDE